jgi:hypothetical protein
MKSNLPDRWSVLLLSGLGLAKDLGDLKIVVLCIWRLTSGVHHVINELMSVKHMPLCAEQLFCVN